MLKTEIRQYVVCEALYPRAFINLYAGKLAHNMVNLKPDYARVVKQWCNYLNTDFQEDMSDDDCIEYLIDIYNRYNTLNPADIEVDLSDFKTDDDVRLKRLLVNHPFIISEIDDPSEKLCKLSLLRSKDNIVNIKDPTAEMLDFTYQNFKGYFLNLFEGTPYMGTVLYPIHYTLLDKKYASISDSLEPFKGAVMTKDSSMDRHNPSVINGGYIIHSHLDANAKISYVSTIINSTIRNSTIDSSTIINSTIEDCPGIECASIKDSRVCCVSDRFTNKVLNADVYGNEYTNKIYDGVILNCRQSVISEPRNKYVLSRNDTLVYNGQRLHRIKYIDGTLGGYIFDYSCLSQEGDCRVDVYSKVCRGCQVFGDAKLVRTTLLSNSKVFGNSKLTQCIIDDSTIYNSTFITCVVDDYFSINEIHTKKKLKNKRPDSYFSVPYIKLFRNIAEE